jgi:hypothetical protein
MNRNEKSTQNIIILIFVTVRVIRYVQNSTGLFLVAMKHIKNKETVPVPTDWLHHLKSSNKGLREATWYLRLLWSPDGEQKPPRCVCGRRPRLGYSPATAAFVFI